MKKTLLLSGLAVGVAGADLPGADRARKFPHDPPDAV